MRNQGRESDAADQGASGAFSRLGKTVTRHYGKVLVIWLILLLASLPLVLMISEAISPGTGEAGGTDTESVRAQGLISEQFPRSLANSSAIIVIQAADVTNDATKGFVLDLGDVLVAEGTLEELEGLTSVYTVQQAFLEETTSFLGPTIYGIWVQTNFTAFLVYGVPATYLVSWLATDANLTVTERDQAANVTTFALLESFANEAGLNVSTRQLVFGYYGLFFQAWAASVGNMTLVSNPPLRAESAIDASVPLFIGGLMDPLLAGFIVGVWQGFSLTNWSDPDAIRAFAIAQITALTEGQFSPNFLEAVFALGRNPTPEDVAAFARQTVEAGSLDAFPLPAEILGGFVNEANDTMLIIIAFTKAPRGFGSPEGDPIIDNVLVIRDAISALLADPTVPIDRALVTGDAAATADAAISGAADFERIEPVTIAALIILIGLFFLSLVIPFVPLGAILMAFLLAEAMVFLIGTFVAKVQDTTLTFLFTIMIGVGTDYAVFLIARYREERVGGDPRDEAVRTSVTWAGESIATSGAAVIIAFGVLALGSFALLRTMGLAIGLGVLIALLVSLTLIPAILMLLGERVFWPTSGKRFARYAERVRRRRAEKKSYFYRAAEMSVSHPRAVLGLAVLISLPAIYVALTATTSFDFIGGLSQAESVDGLQVLQESFGAGLLGPTQVILRFPARILVDGNLTAASAGALEDLSTTIAGQSNVRELTGPTRPLGTPVDATNLTGLGPSERLAALAAIGSDNRTALLTAVFVESPFTTTSMGTVDAIRAAVRTLQEENALLASAEILVGGQTALTRDFAVQTTSEFRTMMVIVVIGIFIVLLVVLGSYLLPLAAVLSIGLSITWAYSATILFFNQVLQAEVLFLIPLILFILLFGIGMDYNIFILTRIREEAQKGKDTHRATVDAVDRTGAIITALALILAVAVGSLMLSSNRLLQGFGFAIALAVLLDAMVVRTYIVPATMAFLGKWAWRGPRRLQRVK